MLDPPPDTKTVLPARLGYDAVALDAGMLFHPNRRRCACLVTFRGRTVTLAVVAGFGQVI
jgi:hypothetical protein